MQHTLLVIWIHDGIGFKCSCWVLASWSRLACWGLACLMLASSLSSRHLTTSVCPPFAAYNRGHHPSCSNRPRSWWHQMTSQSNIYVMNLHFQSRSSIYHQYPLVKAWCSPYKHSHLHTFFVLAFRATWRSDGIPFLEQNSDCSTEAFRRASTTPRLPLMHATWREFKPLCGRKKML